MPEITTVRVTTRVQASARSVFALVSEPQHAVTVIGGLEQLSPIGEQVSGVGARFDAVLHLGPKRVSAQVEIAELIENRLVTWASVGGETRSITFELRDVEDATAVRLTISYERAEGLSGMLLSPIIEETVRARAHHTLARLRELGLEQTNG